MWSSGYVLKISGCVLDMSAEHKGSHRCDLEGNSGCGPVGITRCNLEGIRGVVWGERWVCSRVDHWVQSSGKPQM